MDEDDEKIESGNNTKMNESPEHLYSLLDQYVELQLIKQTFFSGFLYSIDPLTKSVILQMPKDDAFQTVLIPGHAVVEIIAKSAPDHVVPPVRKAISTDDSEEVVLARKKKLIAWFKMHLLPITEEGENIVVGSVHVMPPYKTTNIYAESPIVAMQIKDMMLRIPEDFDVSQS